MSPGSHRYFWLLLFVGLLATRWLFPEAQPAKALPWSSLPAQPPELVLQTGHSKKVNSVAFSPDNRLLASGSADFSVVLWDLVGTHELRRLIGHSNWVNCVAFSPDGKLIASGSNDKSIKLWDVVTGGELRTLSGHDSPVESIAFSPDGRWLASGSSDKTARVWEVATASFRPFKDHSDWVTSIGFSPDGKSLATGSRDKTIRIWDLESDRPPHLLRGHTDSIKALAFSPDGQLLASGGVDGTVRIWKTSTGREVRSLPDNSCGGAPAARGKPCIIAVAFVDGGRELLSANSKKVVSIWETATGRQIRSVGDKDSLDLIESAAFSSDGRTLASSGDNAPEVYNVETGAKAKTFDSRIAGLYALAFSADGRWLATGGKDWAVHLWDTASGRQLPRLIGHASYITSIALSHDGRYLASGSLDHTVRLWDTSTTVEQIPTLLAHEESVRAVAFSPDDRWLASGGFDRTVRIWDPRSGKLVQKLPGHSGEITTVAFSSDGRLLASGSVDKTVRIWDTTTWAEPRILTLGSEVEAVAFGPDNKLACGGGDTIRLFEVSSGTEIRVLRSDQGLVRGLAFSPKQAWLASAWSDRVIRLWDPTGSPEPRVLQGHSDSVSAVVFSPDGKSLASSGEDGSTLVWDVDSRKQMATLISLRDTDDWLAVTPDGLFDGSPRAWDEILWRFGNTFDFKPVEVFFSEFFYPSLLADVISGKKRPAPKSISEKDRRQPAVTFSLAPSVATAEPVASRKVEIKIGVTEVPPDKDYSAGSGVRDVRLFRNGSLVKVWHGDLKLNETGKAELQWSVPIVAGENILTAYAFNRDSIKSSNATLAITGAENLKRDGTVYIVVVGINEYANQEFNLRYARADAQDFGEELGRAQLRLGTFADIQVVPLFDSEATRDNIMLAIHRLAATSEPVLTDAPQALAKIRPAQPEDIVVIYFAGHGKSSGEPATQVDSISRQAQTDGRFYLIPHDLGYSGPRDQLDLKKIFEHSISDKDLEKALEQIDARRVLLVIDACNSGQAVETEDKRFGPMNSKGLPQLAYEKGMFILTAAQSFQAALERRDLGHGYLTYALVEEGLKKDLADIKPKDGKVTLEEWFDYAVTRVPQMQAGTATDTKGRILEHEPENPSGKKKQREVQRPAVFYPPGLTVKPLIVARTEIQ